MARYGNFDYTIGAKGGFLLGFALLVIGAGGELIGHAVFGTLPSWENTLLFNLEVLGLLIGFFSPLIFGIILPLTQ